MRHFTCDLVSLLEEDPLGKNIVNIFAQYRTITSKEPLSHRVRIERVSPVRSCPYIFLCSSYTTSCQAHYRLDLEIEHAANSRPCAHCHIQPYVSFGQHGRRSD